jgi:hypothetical protein
MFTLFAASGRLSASFSNFPPCRIQPRFLSTQIPSIHIPDHPISEKLRQRTHAAVLQTPEEIWKQKSKKALEDAISSPPTDPYTGIIARTPHFQNIY